MKMFECLPIPFVDDSIMRLKNKLETMGYVVMAFLNLDSEMFLNFVTVFRRICGTAQNASILIYVGGYGFHHDSEDFLLPIDVTSVFHASGHETSSLLRHLRNCSLENLLASFETTETNTFTVTCLWDMCRSSW